MANKTNTVFSKEIIEFSKVIDESFTNVSKDMLTLTSKTEKSSKGIKADIERLTKDITYLKITFNSLKKEIAEVEKKVKRNTGVTTAQKPVNNKDELKELKTEIADMKLSIKNIEKKLKMD